MQRLGQVRANKGADMENSTRNQFRLQEILAPIEILGGQPLAGAANAPPEENGLFAKRQTKSKDFSVYEECRVEGRYKRGNQFITGV
jgi:hypothetical protein